jgi:hypothetical protein
MASELFTRNFLTGIWCNLLETGNGWRELKSDVVDLVEPLCLLLNCCFYEIDGGLYWIPIK